jgi:predicted transcriptional regulator
MPYRDRAARLAYADRYHAAHRPAPQPAPQRDGSLPPRGILAVDDDGSRVQCHECGRWFGGLPAHIRTHGLDADRYKERYDLARGLSLWSPQYQERQRQAALARNLGDVGRAALEEIGPSPRPAGITDRLSSRLRYSAAKRKPPC